MSAAPDYAELVRDLRGVAAALRDAGAPLDERNVEDHAADAIEALVARVAEKQTVLAELTGICMETLNELPRLVETTSLVLRARAVVARISALEAENAALRGALRNAFFEMRNVSEEHPRAFENGNTDPNGCIDEGAVWHGRLMEDIKALLGGDL